MTPVETKSRQEALKEQNSDQFGKARCVVVSIYFYARTVGQSHAFNAINDGLFVYTRTCSRVCVVSVGIAACSERFWERWNVFKTKRSQHTAQKCDRTPRNASLSNPCYILRIFSVAVQEKAREEVEKKLEARAREEKEVLKRERQELFFDRRNKQAQLRKLEHKMELVQIVRQNIATRWCTSIMFAMFLYAAWGLGEADTNADELRANESQAVHLLPAEVAQLGFEEEAVQQPGRVGRLQRVRFPLDLLF